MAFATDNTVSATVTKGNFEAALGFVNLSLPNLEGTPVKFGAIPLKASNAAEADMDEKLNDPAVQAELLAWIKANLVITYGKNNSGSKKPLFGFVKKAA